MMRIISSTSLRQSCRAAPFWNSIIRATFGTRSLSTLDGAHTSGTKKKNNNTNQDATTVIPALTIQDLITAAKQAFEEFEEAVPDHSNVPLLDSCRLRRIELSMERMCSKCRQFETQESVTGEDIALAKSMVRKIAEPFVGRGPFGREIVSWPRGPGSSTAMKFVYEGLNLPTYSAQTHYMEWYLRTRDLALAVRSRKDTLRDLLEQEILRAGGTSRTGTASHNKIRILDLANGPFQSMKELLLGQLIPEAILQRIDYVGVDTDKDIQHENALWIRDCGSLVGDGSFQFQVNNATTTPFMGNDDNKESANDIVFSTGFFDYLPDARLVELWQKCFRSLKPGGSLIISLKDCDKYHAQVYHFAMAWDQFLQRNEPHFQVLLDKAGLEVEQTVRDQTGIILFYVVRK